MNTHNRRFLAASALLILAGSGALAGLCCRQHDAAERPGQEAGRAVESEAPPVAGAPGAVAEVPVPDTFTIDTHLVVDQDVAVTARMTGIVEAILVDRGSRVSTGDPLLRLMNRDLLLLVQRAEIALKQKRADFERARRLFAERTLSESEFESIQLALEAAEVEVAMAREELEKSFVRAPFDGLITDRFARIGQKVIEDESEPLFRLTALAPLQVRLYLPEEVARSVRRGDRVEVRPQHAPGGPVTATVEWVSSVIDASSGTSLAILSVPSGRRGGLAPGTAVTVSLSLRGPGGVSANGNPP